MSHREGLSFDPNPQSVSLADFQFLVRERFLYEYDFNDHWEHEVRVEQILGLAPERTYPVCIWHRGHAVCPPPRTVAEFAYS